MPRFTANFALLINHDGECTSRRSVLRSLAGTGAAGLLAALGLSQTAAPAAARRGRRRRPRCRTVQQTCTASRQCCNGRVCLNNGCGAGSVCCSPSGGRCAADCDCCGSGICNFATGLCV